MIFGRVPVENAEGAILVHTQRLAARVLKKGTVLDAGALAALREGGISAIIAARLKRLRALGHDEASLARIHGPVGLDIEAVTAPEIALSILAEIVAARRGATMGQKAAA